MGQRTCCYFLKLIISSLFNLLSPRPLSDVCPSFQVYCHSLYSLLHRALSTSLPLISSSLNSPHPYLTRAIDVFVLDPTLCLTLSVSALYTLYSLVYSISKMCRVLIMQQQFCQCFSMQIPGIVILITLKRTAVRLVVTANDKYSLM